MKWPHHRNLRNRPPTPSKGRGPVQVQIRRAFIASGAEVLSSTQIYDWTHSRRRQSRRKKLPFGVYWRTLKMLRAMCDPIERVPPHGALLRRWFFPVGGLFEGACRLGNLAWLRWLSATGTPKFG